MAPVVLVESPIAKAIEQSARCSVMLRCEQTRGKTKATFSLSLRTRPLARSKARSHLHFIPFKRDADRRPSHLPRDLSRSVLALKRAWCRLSWWARISAGFAIACLRLASRMNSRAGLGVTRDFLDQNLMRLWTWERRRVKQRPTSPVVQSVAYASLDSSLEYLAGEANYVELWPTHWKW